MTSKNYDSLLEESENKISEIKMGNKKVNDRKTIETFLLNLELNSITITDLYALNINEFNNYLNELKFEEQQNIIKNYYNFYIQDDVIGDGGDRSLFFGDRILVRKDFSFEKIIISPNNEKLGLLDETSIMNIVDIKSKKNLIKFPYNLNNNDIRFSFDSRKIAFSQYLSNIIVIDIETYSIEYSYIQEPNLKFIVFSKSDYNLAIVYDNKVKINKNQESHEINDFSNITCLDFSLQNNSLCCFASAKNIIIWDFIQNNVRANIEEINNCSKIFCIQFSDSGTKLVFATDNNFIVVYSLIYDLNSKINLSNACRLENIERIKKIRFSSNEQFIFSYKSSDNDSEIVLLKQQKSDQYQYLPETIPYPQPLEDVICYENKFVTVTNTNKIVIFDPFSLKSLKKQDEIPFGNKYDKPYYSPKGDILAKIIDGNKISLFNTESGLGIKQLYFNEKNEDFEIIEMVFSSDGSKIIAHIFEELHIFDIYGKKTPIYGPIKYNCSRLKIFAMSKNGNLVTGHEDGEINYYINNVFSQNTLEQAHKSAISCLSFDKKEEILASGDLNGSIILWNNWKYSKKIKGISMVYNIIFSKNTDELFIIYERNIEIWNIQQLVLNQTISGFNDKNLRFSLNKEENLLLFAEGSDITVMKKIKDKFEIIQTFSIFWWSNLIEIIFKPENEDILILKGNMSILEINNYLEKLTIKKSKNENILFIGEHKIISSIKDSDQNETILVKKRKSNIIICEPFQTKLHDFQCFLSMDESQLLISSFDGYDVWNLNIGKLIKSGKTSNKVRAARYQKADKKMVALLTRDSKIYLWEDGSDNPFKKEISLKLEPVNIGTMDYSFNGKNLIILCNNNQIQIYDFNTSKIIKSINAEKEESFICTRCSFNDFKIFCLGYFKGRRNIKIFDGDDILKIIECPVYFSFIIFYIDHHNNLFFLNDKSIYFMKPQQEGTLLRVCEMEKTINSLFITNHNDLFIENKEEMIVFPNFYKNVYFYKENSEQLRNIISNQKVKNLNYEGLIPFNYNYLQIFSYCEAIQDNFKTFFSYEVDRIDLDLFFSKDIHARNSFDIIFFSKNTKLFTNFLNYILNNYQIKNLSDFIDYFNADFLLKLIMIYESNPIMINTFMQFVFSEPIDFPEGFLYNSLQNPILMTLEKPKLNKENLLKIVENTNSNIDDKTTMKEVINAKCLYVEELLNDSNENTIELFKKISNFEPTNLFFSNQAIIKILEYKWNLYAKRIYFIEAFIFLMFLTIYLLNANYFIVYRLNDQMNSINSNTYIYCLVLDLLIILFVVKHIYEEIKQYLNFKMKDYITNLWNIIDLILIFLSFMTTIIDILSCFDIWMYPDALKVLHSFTILFGFLRLLSYARGFEGSAFMIKLIIQVIYDIKYFLLLMFIFIIGLGCSVYILQTDYEFDGFQTFISFFRQMIGDLGDFDEIYEEVVYIQVLYCFFFIASIVLTISMLNLLIAIISDTFAKVKSAENLTKIWERWNIITEIDVLHAKDRKISNGKKQYLLFLYNDCQIENESNEINEIKSKLDQFVEKDLVFKDETKNNYVSLKNDMTSLQNKMEELLTEVKKNKAEL